MSNDTTKSAALVSSPPDVPDVSSGPVLAPKLAPSSVSMETSFIEAFERSQVEQRGFFRDMLLSFAKELKSSSRPSSPDTRPSSRGASSPDPELSGIARVRSEKSDPSSVPHFPPATSPTSSSFPRDVLKGPTPSSESPPPDPRPSVDLVSQPLSSTHQPFVPPQDSLDTPPACFIDRPAFVPPTPKPVVTFHVSKWTKEVRDLHLSSETFDAVCSWYDTIQQSMIVATDRSDILPELDELSQTYDFAAHILPHSNSSVYKAALAGYTSMAKALRIYLMKPLTIHSNCASVIEKRKINQFQRDGFVLLLNLLGGVFPHMGGPQLDVIQEISSLSLAKGETLDSLLLKFVDMDRKLQLSGHKIPPTAMISKYLSLLKLNERLFTIISPIHREFHSHMLLHGPDVPFSSYNFPDIHSYIKYSGVATDAIIFLGTSPHAASASVFLSQDPVILRNDERLHSHTSRDIVLQSSAAELAPSSHTGMPSSRRRPSAPKCPICFLRHHPLRCWVRGEKFQPTWLKRNAQKYNALHPDDVVEASYINQAPPLRLPQANKVSFDDATFMDDDRSTTSLTVFQPEMDVLSASTLAEVDDMVHHVAPTCNMADATDATVQGAASHATVGIDDESFVEC